MDRREFIAGTLCLLAAPLAAEAQPGKVYRVVLIHTTSPLWEVTGPDPVDATARAFARGLLDLGYVEGKNLALTQLSAEGKTERYTELVAEAVRRKADVIVTITNLMAQRAKEVTTTVPIVMAASFDPVGVGIVQSLARPGGNVTGLTWAVGPEIEAKRLQLLKETLPGASRVAYLSTKAEWEEPQGGKVAREAAQALGVAVVFAEHTANDYTDAFAAISRSHLDAIFVSGTPSHWVHRRRIVEFAMRARLPSVFAAREAVEIGGLMSYGVNVPDLFRRAAGYVDRILKGAKPADLPVEQPTKFELVINMKTAKALGLTIPQSLLLRADEVIE
jgi:putative ABC transport system substrate-binding protein